LERLLGCRWQNVTGVLQHADVTASDGSLAQQAKAAITSWLVLRWACGPARGIVGISCP
jgi:hypothetical protein